MKKFINVNGVMWPDTGRKYPVGSVLEIHNLHDKWLDLMWFNGNIGLWEYVSTLPNGNKNLGM